MATAIAIGTALALAAAGAPAASYHLAPSIAGPDGGWDYLRVDAANNRLLVARGAFVEAVDLASGAVAGDLAPGAGLHDALPIKGGAEILVTNGASDTAVFTDRTGHTVLATVHTGKGPDAAAFDPATGLVLTMDHGGGDVTLIDPAAHRAVATVPVGGALEAAALDGKGRAFVNVEDKNQIAVLDLKERRVTARWTLTGCDGPTGLVYDAADKLLIAACDGASDVVDATSGKVLQTLPTGKGADGVAWDEGRRLAFVPAGQDGKLSVIALAQRKATIVQTVETERGARTITEDPRTGRVYLPSAKMAPSPTGGRPTRVPGSFHLVVVAP